MVLRNKVQAKFQVRCSTKGSKTVPPAGTPQPLVLPSEQMHSMHSRPSVLVCCLLPQKAKRQWSESARAIDLWKIWESDHFRSGKNPKGPFTDGETEVNWLFPGIYQ